MLLVAASGYAMDLKNAVMVAPIGLAPPERKAAVMLSDEIERRTRIRLPIADRWPQSGPPIFVGREAQLWAMHSMELMPPASGAEGYRLHIEANTIVVVENDARGALFGAGALLQRLRMERDTVEAPDPLRFASVPRYPLRGHQLGYRPKTNSYDGWSVTMWEQYIRDLAAFCTNA